MAVFYAVFVPCLAQRSLGQGVEFWDAMTNVIVYEGFLTHLKISFFFFPCLQSLFQEDFNKSLESAFGGVTKSKW